MIKVEMLRKQYRRQVRDEGVVGALKGLFVKQYEDIDALKDVSFSVDRGESVGYLGVNGSGKSTTIKVLSGVLFPTAGNVEVNGLVPYADRKNHVRQLGVVFGQRSQLWADLPMIESFKLVSSLYGVSDVILRQRLPYFVQAFELEELLSVPVRQLSLGQRMRAEIVVALLHTPPVLLLDEPTLGLDLFAKQALRDCLVDIRERTDTTIFLASHDMADIEAVCKRVILLNEGQVIYDGSIRQLKVIYEDTRYLEISLADAKPVPQMESVEEWKQEGSTLKVILRQGNKNHISTVVNYVSQFAEYSDVKAKELTLEQIVRALYASRRSAEKSNRIEVLN